jgi:hypothetical protein
MDKLLNMMTSAKLIDSVFYQLSSSLMAFFTVNHVAENCAVEKGISTEVIFNYFLNGLSFSLQKSIAHSIQFKLSNRCSVNSAFNANAILLAAEDHV